MFSRKSINSKPEDYKIQRSAVSRIILNVLCGHSSVKDALLNFPKDVDDLSIQTAWHALTHYDADEELRLKDREYREVQNDFLEFIAFSLRDNIDLPVNIINAYLPYYKNMPIADNSTIEGKFHKFLRYLNIN